MKNKIDSHIHLGDFSYIEDIIRNIQKNNQYALCVTNTPEQFEYLYKKGLHQNKRIKIALGYNPQEIVNRKFNALQFMKSYRYTNYIGEVGLDYSKEYLRYREQQKQVFTYICSMAGRDRKILSIHSRNAEYDILEIVKKQKVNNYIMHWYTGSFELVKEFISTGGYFSINNRMIKSKKIINLLDTIPSSRILVETDAPYTMQNTNIYSKILDDTYEFLNKKGISREMIFDNFKTLLMKMSS